MMKFCIGELKKEAKEIRNFKSLTKVLDNRIKR